LIVLSSIERVALMPSGGPLADAIGINLLSYSIDVIDTSTTTGILARLNLNEFEINNPQNIRLLSEQGIDTILIVKTVAGYDGRPNSATARLVDTKSGRLLIGATWENGKGGAKGSAADGMMRQNINSAAQTLSNAIGRALIN
jgi:thiazole synthase ThiGH ThiG subunit